MEIKVPTSEMEIIFCPQWGCYGLKPKGYNAYYNIGTKKECEEWLEFYKSREKVLGGAL